MYYGTSLYNIDISEISFGQTFVEESYSVKTLHNRALFEASIINKANPANFNFTFPAIREDDLKVVFDRALDYDTFELYIKTSQDIYRIRNCVITQGTIILEKTRPLSMNISGEASQLSIVSSMPGTEVLRDANRTYTRISDLDILLGGTTTLSDDLAAISIELQNNIKWLPYVTIGAPCIAGTTLMYPEDFVLEDRELGGVITRYLTDLNNTDLQTWSIDTALYIFAGQATYGFELDMTNCHYTNRLGTGEVYTHSYDWGMTQNPTNLSDIITYTTY
jgi:hypothetical protein